MNQPFNFINTFFEYRDKLRFKPPGGGLNLYERLVNYIKYKDLKSYMSTTYLDFCDDVYDIRLERCDIEEIIDLINSSDFHYYINTRNKMYTKYKLGDRITISLADENHVRNCVNNIVANGITCFFTVIHKERIKISCSNNVDIFISAGRFHDYGNYSIEFEVFNNNFYSDIHITPDANGECYIDEFQCEDEKNAEGYFAKIYSLLETLKDIDNMPTRLNRYETVCVDIEHTEVNFENKYYVTTKYPTEVNNLYPVLAEVIEGYMKNHRNHINTDLMEASAAITNYVLREIYKKALAGYINNYLKYIFKRYVSGGEMYGLKHFLSTTSKIVDRFHSFVEWLENGDITNKENRK